MLPPAAVEGVTMQVSKTGIQCSYRSHYSLTHGLFLRYMYLHVELFEDVYISTRTLKMEI